MSGGASAASMFSICVGGFTWTFTDRGKAVKYHKKNCDNYNSSATGVFWLSWKLKK